MGGRVEQIECRACGTIFDRHEIRCPACRTVTRRVPDTKEGETCRSCVLIAAVSVALLLFWLYVFLTRVP